MNVTCLHNALRAIPKIMQGLNDQYLVTINLCNLTVLTVCQILNGNEEVQRPLYTRRMDRLITIATSKFAAGN